MAYILKLTVAIWNKCKTVKAKLLLGTLVSVIIFGYLYTKVILPSPFANEEKIINTYVEQISVKDGIGQLIMTGLPVDYRNYKDSDKLKKMFSEYGVGNAIVNAYNFYNRDNKYDDNQVVASIIEFNNNIQLLSNKSRLALPVLIAADFESPNYTSVRNGLTLPPSALSLGACQRPEYIRQVGQLVGVQLKSIGIQILLGPVLDTYNVSQGNTSILQDRCFASSPNDVIKAASHFTKGLSQAQILTFAKHFPSHGAIESNPHDYTVPIYEGSKNQLQMDIKPFVGLSDNIDGVMTSHIELDGVLSTVSKKFITDTLRSEPNVEKKVIITDDLTSMGAIRKYSKENKLSYEQLAIRAFDAGHDVLLFSHFSELNKGKSDFSLNDLNNVILALTKYIESSEANKKRFKESLKKIVRLKIKAAGDNKRIIYNLLQHKETNLIYKNNSDPVSIKKNVVNALNEDNAAEKINSSDEVIINALRSSVRQISTNDTNSSSLDNSKDLNVIFCVYESQIDKFNNAFSNVVKKADFKVIPHDKSSMLFSNMEKFLSSKLRTTDLLVYTIYDVSDVHLLERMSIQAPNIKMVLFCHNSPLLLTQKLIKTANVVGIFTNHPLSYNIDIEVLQGKLRPSSIDTFPVVMGKYHVGENVIPYKEASITNMHKISSKYLNENNFDYAMSNDYYVIKKSNAIYAIIVILLFIFIMYLANKWLLLYDSNNNNVIFIKKHIILFNILILLASISIALAIANKKKTLRLLDDIIQIKDKASVIFK
jgi:beta-glucosidase-like glycosyl hydrolase